jgi:hypothetical protein
MHGADQARLGGLAAAGKFIDTKQLDAENMLPIVNMDMGMRIIGRMLFGGVGGLWLLAAVGCSSSAPVTASDGSPDTMTTSDAAADTAAVDTSADATADDASVDVAPDASGGVHMTVGTGGGSVMTIGGDGVSVPAGALAADVDISVRPAPTAPAPATATAVGAIVVFGPEGQQFASPATVTLAFDPAKLPAGKTAANIVILTAPASTSAYTTLVTTVVDATHVSAKTSHFSDFVPAVPAPDGPSCTSNVECATGMVCAGGHCVAS